MNGRDMADRIGNIDDRLVQQAERLPNYRAQHRRRVFMRFAACAAAVLLMFGSFVTGAVAFSGNGAEGPVMLTLEEIGLTLILPEEWRDNYTLEVGEIEDGYLYTIYDRRIYESEGEWQELGALFYIGSYGNVPMSEQEVMDADIFDGAIPYQYLCSTRNTNYIMVPVTDVQYDPDDEEMAANYDTLAQGIRDIRFVLDNVWKD